MTGSEDSRFENEPGLPVDITKLLAKAWKQFLRSWWLLLLLMALCAGLSLASHAARHRDLYEAYASFSVSAGNPKDAASTYNTRVSLNQLGKTFPFILESGALNTVVREKLGLASLPVTISAEVVSDTSLFRISVSGEDPELCRQALDAVIENYPQVAQYVIGKTMLTMLDYSGTPVTPVNLVSRRSLVIRGAKIGGLIYLAVLGALVVLRRTVESENDLKGYTSLRCLASIPFVLLKKRSRKKKLLLINRTSVPPAFTEAFNLLRVRLLREMDRKGKKVLMLTSAGEREGKTTVSANLALCCAQKGFRVLLIDCDLRHPSVAACLGVTVEREIADVLRGRLTVSEAIEPCVGSLDILAGAVSLNAADIPKVLTTDAVEKLMEYAREHYDYIFVDTPPCGIIQDALAIAPACDAAVAVIRQDYLARTRILEVLNLLTDSNAGLIGCVINGESGGVGSYGHGRYGYGSGYGAYGRYGRYGTYGSSKYTQRKTKAR